jgi:O-antigen ligase
MTKALPALPDPRLRWWAAFVAASLLLPPLPFALGNSGPHVALLFAAAGLWAGLSRCSEWRVGRDLVSLLMAAFTGWLAFTALMAVYYSGLSVAAGSLARVGLFGIGVYAYFYFRHGPGRLALRDPLGWALGGFILASVAALWACVDFYFQFLPAGDFAEQFIWFPGGVYRRAQGVFREAGMLGNLCALFLTSAAAAWVQPEVRIRIAGSRLLFAGVLILSAALVLSFSRSSVVNLMTALAALAALERKRIRWFRAAAQVAGILAATSAVLYLSAPQILAAYWRRMTDTLIYSWTLPGEMLSGRLETWQALLQHLADHPWVLGTGIGYKTLPYSSYFGQPQTADNMYLTILAEAGIPGLFLLLALSGAMLASCLRARSGVDSTCRFFATWFFCFWMGQMAQMAAADALTYWRILPLAFFVLAVTERSVRDAS